MKLNRKRGRRGPDYKPRKLAGLLVGAIEIRLMLGGISHATLHRWIKVGLPYEQAHRRGKRLFRPTQVFRWLEERRDQAFRRRMPKLDRRLRRYRESAN